jgi:hypothetical protein
MHDPTENKFVTVPQQMPRDDARHKWTRFEEGEIINLRGIDMRVAEIGESRIVLKLIKESA